MSLTLPSFFPTRKVTTIVEKTMGLSESWTRAGNSLFTTSPVTTVVDPSKTLLTLYRHSNFAAISFIASML